MSDTDFEITAVRSMSEILSFTDEAVQTILLWIHLEYLLKRISPEPNLELDTLLREHVDKFVSLRAQEVHEARRIRNDLIHSNRLIAPQELRRAIKTLRRAIGDVVEFCTSGKRGFRVLLCELSSRTERGPNYSEDSRAAGIHNVLGTH